MLFSEVVLQALICWCLKFESNKAKENKACDYSHYFLESSTLIIFDLKLGRDNFIDVNFLLHVNMTCFD